MSDGLLESCHRPLELPLLRQQDAQVVVRFGKAGPQGDRLLEACRRFAGLARSPEDDAQVVVGLGDIGTLRQNLSIGLGRFDQPAGMLMA